MKSTTRSGFTLLEVSIVFTIFAILVGGVLTIASDTLKYTNYANANMDVQHEAQRAFNRAAEILRKSGWNNVGVTEYPRVSNEGTEIQFRMLADLDGNGFPFDDANGDLEWGNNVMTIRLDTTTRMLNVYSSDGEILWVLGRHVESVQFSTFRENAALDLREVLISVTTSKETHDGTPVTYVSNGSLFLRN